MGPDYDAVGSFYAQGAHQHGEGGRAGGGVARHGIDSAFPCFCRNGRFAVRGISGGAAKSVVVPVATLERIHPSAYGTNGA